MKISCFTRSIGSYCCAGLFLSATALLTLSLWESNGFAQGYAFPSSTAVPVSSQPHSLQWERDFDTAMIRAKKESRPLFIHFCLPNQSMETQVFSQPSIASRLLANYVILKIDVSENTTLPQKFAVSVVPTDIVLTPKGELAQRRMGEITAERFSEYLSFLQKILLPANAPANAAPVNAMVGSSVGGEQSATEPVHPSVSTRPPAAMPPVSVSAVSSASSASVLPGAVPQRSTLPIGEMPASVVNNSVVHNPFGEQHAIAGNNNSERLHDEKMISNPLRVYDHSAQVLNTPTFQVPAENPVILATDRTKPTHVTAETKKSEFVEAKKTVEVPLALEGFCPVTLCSEERWVTGNPAYCTMYQGHIFRFASLDALSDFAQKPESFVPVAMGEDVVYMADRNKKVQGQRQFGAWFQGRIFLFASLETLSVFESRPEYYTEIALKYETARRDQPTTVIY